MGTGRLSDKSWSRIWELQWGFDVLNVRYHVFSLDEVWRLFILLMLVSLLLNKYVFIVDILCD